VVLWTPGRRHARIGVLNQDVRLSRDAEGSGERREAELASLSDVIQKRLHASQNPPDCRSARKLRCDLDKRCGFACQFHHVVYCLLVAYANQRTLVLDSSNWSYSKRGWESVLLPVSERCTVNDVTQLVPWADAVGRLDDVDTVDLPMIDVIEPRPDYLPEAVPADMARRLARTHSHPSAWWVGQLADYLFKLQPELATEMRKVEAELDFASPVVGVHVRRTDKVIKEALAYDTETYVEEVRRYDARRLHTLPTADNAPSKIYLATDDPEVLSSAKKKYAEYRLLATSEVTASAGLDMRYTDASLRGVIRDVYFLSRTDYLVCHDVISRVQAGLRTAQC
ncbi:PREDICTED: LOW QUALITY PROTEIN: alpha-(1,6)-fucosyltransferase-like, partial [Priapulus caudatus]|uniref:LOW QUALITY PROTEIN: alpha-(1,6)-fucosyltransferase-like n=1 Tax=Priapulus caudatus TaxID=37621 RepID=A0ABM1DYU5_PRICU